MPSKNITGAGCFYTCYLFSVAGTFIRLYVRSLLILFTRKKSIHSSNLYHGKGGESFPKKVLSIWGCPPNVIPLMNT
jgi:hypothetical protein